MLLCTWNAAQFVPIFEVALEQRLARSPSWQLATGNPLNVVERDDDVMATLARPVRLDDMVPRRSTLQMVARVDAVKEKSDFLGLARREKMLAIYNVFI